MLFQVKTRVILKYFATGCSSQLIKLNNGFDFPDPKPQIINILYMW